MNDEYERLLNITRNEDFIKTCFKRIQSLDIRDEDFQVLTDVDLANKLIMEWNRFTYPIIVEVPNIEDIPKSFTHVKGSRRYYSDKYYYKGKYYLLCNDWYYPTPGKKNTKDNRTPFIKWIMRMETR